MVDGRALRVDLRIDTDADLEGRNLTDAGGEFGGVLIAVGARNIGPAQRPRWIAAQGHNVPDAGGPVVANHLIDVGT